MDRQGLVDAGRCRGLAPHRTQHCVTIRVERCTYFLKVSSARWKLFYLRLRFEAPHADFSCEPRTMEAFLLASQV